MGIETLTVLMIAAIIALLLLGLPMAFTTGAVATLFTFIIYGPDALQLMVTRVFDIMNNYVLVSVPLFVFMANMLEKAGVADRMYSAIHVWSGRMPGGLAIGTIVACTVMAAMVGIVGAEVVTLGLVAVPTMLNRGYHRSIALGCVCAGGGLGTLIPPSVVFIVYALTAGVSVGKLFIAGVFPGLLLAGLYILYILGRCALNPGLAPPAPAAERAMPLPEKLAQLRGLILPVFIAGAVLGSIYTGVATPSEAAGVGCVGATIACAVNGRFNLSALKAVLIGTARVSCMLYWMIFGAQTIIGIYTMAGGSKFVMSMMQSLPLGPYGIVILMQVILAVLGCFVDWIGICLLTMPLFVPIVTALGFDPVWFGVIFCMNMQLSYISPPFAPSAFYLKGVTPAGITVMDIYKSSAPYMVLIIIALALLMVFPEIALWLPSRFS